MVEEIRKNLGLGPRPADPDVCHHWDYTTLKDAPPLHPDAKKWSSTIYRGLVPAKNIVRRDFAINGAVVRPSSLSESVLRAAVNVDTS